MIIGIDLSLRSTGVCAVDMKGNLIDFLLISNSVLQEEELWIYNWQQLHEFIKAMAARNIIQGFVTEALALHAPSKEKDMLFGHFGYIQGKLAEKYPSTPRGKITVAEWRSSVLTKDEQKKWKAEDKNGLKLGCVDKLPKDVSERFVNYLLANKIKRTASKDPLWDLTDSYWLSKYRLTYE